MRELFRKPKEMIGGDTMMSEFALGFFAFAWGLWLLMPWASFGSSITFSIMESLASEEVWGLVTFTLGVAQIIGSQMKNSVRWRAFLWLGAFFNWFFIFWVFAVANFHSTATPVYFTMSMFSLLVYTSLHKKTPLKHVK